MVPQAGEVVVIVKMLENVRMGSSMSPERNPNSKNKSQTYENKLIGSFNMKKVDRQF